MSTKSTTSDAEFYGLPSNRTLTGAAANEGRAKTRQRANAKLKPNQMTKEEADERREQIRSRKIEAFAKDMRTTKDRGGQLKLIKESAKSIRFTTDRRDTSMQQQPRNRPQGRVLARKAMEERQTFPKMHIKAVEITTSPAPVDQRGRFTDCIIQGQTKKGELTGTLYDPCMRPCEADPTVSGRGVIRFPTNNPIINPQHVTDIVNILKLVCYRCSNFVVNIPPDKITHVLSLAPKARTGELQKVIPKTTQCAVCEGTEERKYSIKTSAEQGRVLFQSVVKSGRTRAAKKAKDAKEEKEAKEKETKKTKAAKAKEEEEEKERPLNEVSIADIERILRNINEETANILGYNKKSMDNFVIYGLRVPCAECRPDPSYKGQVDKEISAISALLEHVITMNEHLTIELGRDTGSVAQASSNLFKAVSAYMSHIYTIHQSKEGLARNNSLGKRSEITTRTVIKGASPEIPFGWFEVPRHDETKLVTLLDVVPANINLCRQLLEMKKIVKIKYNSGRRAGTTCQVMLTAKYEINVGDQVAIKAMHGDWITGFRAPTIHRHSMVSGRMRLIDESVVGIHMALTTPMNADFDGDEITLTKPPSAESLWEMINRLDVRRNIMSSQSGTPILGAVFNAPTAIYRMTAPWVRVDPDLMAYCLMILSSRTQLKTLQKRLVGAGVHQLSGRALFSSVLPEDFSYRRTLGANVDVSAPLAPIVIENGILVRGTIDKSDIGPGVNGNILHRIMMDPRPGYGWERTAKFVTDVYRIANAWDERMPMSVGTNSIIAAFDPKVRAEMQNEYKRLQQATIDPDLSNTEFRNLTELNMGERVIRFDNERQRRAGLPRNSLAIMGDIGAKTKGGIANINDTHSMKGAQVNSLGLMPREMTGGTRLLSSFRPGESTLESRGFVPENYSIGLRSNSFFVACMRDRESLAQTATGVSEIGDLHNKIAIAFGNIGIYNHMVVDAESGMVYQTAYGFDGFDITKTMKLGDKTTFIDLESLANSLSSQSGFTSDVEIEALDSDSLGAELFLNILVVANRVNREYGFDYKTEDELDQEEVKRYLSQLPQIDVESDISFVDKEYDIGNYERLFEHEDTTYKIVYGQTMDDYSYMIPISGKYSGAPNLPPVNSVVLNYAGSQLPSEFGAHSTAITGEMTPDGFVADEVMETEPPGVGCCTGTCGWDTPYDPDIYG